MKNLITLLSAIIICTWTNELLAQTQWTKDPSNPVFTGVFNGWNKHVFDSYVLYNSDSTRYEMWYVGMSSAGIYQIGFAVSNDGISWSTSTTDPVLPCVPGTWEANVFGPMVLKEDGIYRMWYTAGNATLDTICIGYATSPDGRNWTRYSADPIMRPSTALWEAGGVGRQSIIHENGLYEMWYAGVPIGRGHCRIGRAISNDGIAWERDTVNNPVLDLGSVGSWEELAIDIPRVIEIGHVLFMYYTGFTAGYEIRRIGLAVSTDGGTVWTKYSGNPVLNSGSSGSWDARSVQIGGVLQRGDTLHMWYAGRKDYVSTEQWRIGHATSRDKLRRVPECYPTIQSAIDASFDGDTVLVSEGTYIENIRYKGKAIVVGSQFLHDGDTSHISKTIIDGNNPLNPDSGSVVSFIDGEDTTSVLCGFTITGGSGTNDSILSVVIRAGGGIFVKSGARICNNHINGNRVIASQRSAWGGGIEAILDSLDYLIIEDNQITNNLDSTTGANNVTSVSGGGIDINGLGTIGGNGRIVNNTISDNKAINLASNMNAWAGGISLYNVKFKITNNLIMRNRTSAPNCTIYQSWGGGVMTYSVELDFSGNTVVDNIVESVGGTRGGGVSITTESVSGLRETIVEGNYIASNRASGGVSRGGGIFILDQRPLLVNNIIVKNSAPYGGGFGCTKANTANALTDLGYSKTSKLRNSIVGIRNAEIAQSEMISSSPIMINNTIAFNRATTGYGGAIWTSGSWTPIVLNGILWGDTCTQEIYLSGSGINIRYSNIQGGYAGTGNINSDPLFVAGDSMFNLTTSSPCLGHGIDSIQISGIWYHSPTCDCDSHERPRPMGTLPDLGAQEEQTVFVSVQEENELLYTYNLYQNYPNPFNPRTVIRYQIPVKSWTMLKVFNILGQETTTLVNEMQDAGYKSVEFNGSKLPSGVYYYRLQSGNYLETKKLVLIR